MGRGLITFCPDRRIQGEVRIASWRFAGWRAGRKRQDIEFVFQMIQDFIDDSSVFDYGDDRHLSMTVGAKQGSDS